MIGLDRHKLGAVLFASVLAAVIGGSPGAAKGASDIDGAVDALISTPLDVFGDAAGALGLVASAGFGVLGDVAAVVDDNEYTRVLLRGIFSTTIHRVALGTSQMFTGGMEGLRAEDFTAFPESPGDYLDRAPVQTRIDTASTGLGALGLGVVDLMANPGLFLTRLIGMEQQAADIARSQANVRNNWVGSVK